VAKFSAAKMAHHHELPHEGTSPATDPTTSRSSRRLTRHDEADRMPLRRRDVRRLRRFDRARSDIDFIVDFDAAQSGDLFHRHVGLNEVVAELLGRKVDLVMAGALTNPYFIESANRTRQPRLCSLRQQSAGGLPAGGSANAAERG